MADEKPKRLHRATYAADKRKGGYMVRIAGPYAEKFAGREVPVTALDGREHVEKLVRMVWKGVDTGEYGGTVGQVVALYTFEARPREIEPEVTF